MSTTPRLHDQFFFLVHILNTHVFFTFYHTLSFLLVSMFGGVTIIIFTNMAWRMLKDAKSTKGTNPELHLFRR